MSDGAAANEGETANTIRPINQASSMTVIYINMLLELKCFPFDSRLYYYKWALCSGLMCTVWMLNAFAYDWPQTGMICVVVAAQPCLGHGTINAL